MLYIIIYCDYNLQQKDNNKKIVLSMVFLKII